MKSVTNQKHYDVIVVGGGSAGIAAAIVFPARESFRELKNLPIMDSVG